MRTQITALGFISAFGALFAGTSYTIIQWHRLGSARDVVEATRIQHAQVRFAVPEQARPSVKGHTVGEKADMPPAGFAEKLEALKSKAKKGPGGVPLIYPEELFDACPSLREAYLLAKEGEVWNMYGPFYANAGMTAEERRQFCSIIMEREQACLDMRRMLPRSDPASENSPARQEMNRQAELTLKTRLTALLGETRYRLLEVFEAEIDARKMLLGLNKLVATSYYTNEPITVSQMNQIAALATDWGMFQLSKAATLKDPFDELAVRAATILSRSQLEVFDLMLDYQQLALARMQLRSAALPSQGN